MRAASMIVFVATALFACSPSDGHGSRGEGPKDAATDTSTGEPDDTECEGIDFPVAGHPPAVMLVLDRSGSMGEADEGFPPWQSCSQALVQITAQMGHQIRFGLLLFPVDGEGVCAAPEEPTVPIGEATGEEIAQVLEETPLGQGGTPTAQALERAYQHLAGIEDDAARFVVLATDGAPNCGSDPTLDCETCTWTGPVCFNPLSCLDDQGTFSKVAEYHDFWGIDTYVIGVGGVWEVWDEVLQTIAYLGGTGDYYQAQTAEGPEELAAALQEIAAGTTECVFDVDWSSLDAATSEDPDLVNLLVDGEIVACSPDCSFAGGWHWLDEDTIELCPDLCHDYKWGEVSVVRASFGCDTVIE